MGDMCCTLSAQDVSISLLFVVVVFLATSINNEAPNVGTPL